MDKSRWLALLLGSLLLTAGGCRDRIFDNPADPDRSQSAYTIYTTVTLNGIQPLDLTNTDDAILVLDRNSELLFYTFPSGTPIRSRNLGLDISAVAYENGNLWVALRGTNRLVQFNVLNFSQIRSLTFPRGDVVGMDYYQDKLYLADRQSRSVLVIDPNTGSEERQISVPTYSLDGLAVAGETIWLLDAAKDEILRLNLAGTPLGVYPAPGRDGSGLCMYKNLLLCGDLSGKLYALQML